MMDQLKAFFKSWEEFYPDLTLYTGWRMAKRNAKSLEEIETWLKPDRDKFDYVAPLMMKRLESLKG